MTKFLPGHPGGKKAILPRATVLDMLHDPKVRPRCAPDTATGAFRLRVGASVLPQPVPALSLCSARRPDVFPPLTDRVRTLAYLYSVSARRHIAQTIRVRICYVLYVGKVIAARSFSSLRSQHMVNNEYTLCTDTIEVTMAAMLFNTHAMSWERVSLWRWGRGHSGHQYAALPTPFARPA